MNRLKELRKQRGMTQEDLGKLLGVGKATVSKYESGALQLSQGVITALTEAFDVTADYLLGMSGIASDPLHSGLGVQSLYKAETDFVGIPLLGSVHAGSPILAEENIEEYIPHTAIDVRGGDYFYMEVEGDCMTGDFIPEGALVLVRKQSRVANNEIAVVRIEDEVVLRHVKFFNDQIVLVPSNPEYEPMIITGGDVSIIGKVCEVRFSI